MKKLLSIILAGVMMTSLVACSSGGADSKSEAKGETQTITVADAEGKPIDVEFPKEIKRVVALNWQTVDFLKSVGKEDLIVGCLDSSSSTPEHLRAIAEKEGVVSVGSMKDPNMEAIMSLEPDVIFTSDRIENQYDEMSKIAPTMCSYVDYSMGFMEGYKALANKHAQVFGVTGEVDEIINGYETRIEAIADFAEGQTCLLGIFAGGINTLGNEGRASIVVNEMGFKNLQNENINHGNISSYEAWLKINPDWMFILDKDTAVGTVGVAAKEQMEVNNPVIAETKAFKNNQIVYLEPGAAWYVADGGIESLDLMISCIEKGVGLK